ncbi:MULTISPECIES: NHLP bacteriocin system secretion protein [unclassified Synechococcus]|jgi:HlyD family secretion protein|nr:MULTISPECIES: NHLP bacteriocin system secretion protein [unclassified Synechococcus]MEA5422771.1 NHLP bacteriocin system secretion protein [Synechococcus sp. CCY9202]QPN59881.1 NHLP bacteriocin system secretion protein [Synechococcus sp. CBW1002]
MTRGWLGRQVADPEGQVLLAQGGVALLTAAWVLFWPVPTEVRGRGVFIVPNAARVVDARAEGQILAIPVRAGERVRRGTVLFRLDLPALEQEVQRQERDLRELQSIDADLSRRDRLRLAAAGRVRDTALANLRREEERLGALRRTYDQKAADFQLLAQRRVVAPLAEEVVATEDRSTQLAVAIETVRIREKEALDAFEKVKLEIETERQRRRYGIEDSRRSLRVLRARLAYESTLLADRDGTLLDLQVVRGQSVKPGQRLGTLAEGEEGPLKAVAYFAPADARRLRPPLPMEVVPDWDERGRFGGITGQVKQVGLLPATREDIDTTLGNPQLAEALGGGGPVMRVDILLNSDDRTAPNSTDPDSTAPSSAGYRWTLSRGSTVFPIRAGLTLRAHGYVEWRTPISYLLPVFRDLTGSYRNLGQERQDVPALRQKGSLP